MNATDQNNHASLLHLTAGIVSTQLAAQPGEHKPEDLIRSVFDALTSLGQPVSAPPAPLVPAVAINKSVKPDHIVCLEDGKKLKMLKRHIMTQYNLTPEQYRAKWGLPADYPMTAPNYTEKRRELAKSIGLGTKPKR